MPQTLTIGAFSCDPDKAWFTIHRTGIIGGTGRIIKVRNVWSIDGSVNAPTTGTRASQIAAVDAKVVALEAAVRDGIDIRFDLGSTMNLLSSDGLEGTHISKFSWLTGYDGVRGSGAEGLLRRTFHLTIFGDLVTTTDTDIIEWHDSLTYLGTGLDNTVPVGSLRGGVQAQTLESYTPYYIIQSGFAFGLTSRPSTPTPQYQGIPGVYYMPGGVSTSIMTPRRYGRNRNTEFGVRWNYKAWSSLPVTPVSPGVF